jgi:hypothetical protein
MTGCSRVCSVARTYLVANVAYGSMLSKKSKIERHRKSRESRFFGTPPAARYSGANTKAGGRFRMNRCGVPPPGRRARSASAVFKIFVLHPKKTFSTASVKMRRTRSEQIWSAMPRIALQNSMVLWARVGREFGRPRLSRAPRGSCGLDALTALRLTQRTTLSKRLRVERNRFPRLLGARLSADDFPSAGRSVPSEIRSPGTEFLDAETGGQIHRRDRNCRQRPGSLKIGGKIPAETASFRSTTVSRFAKTGLLLPRLFEFAG